MKYRIITMNGYDIVSEDAIPSVFPEAKDAKQHMNTVWEKLMGPRGYSLTEDDNAFLRALFDLVCDEFAEQYHEKLGIHLVEGYLTQDEGGKHVQFNTAPRVMAEEKCVYIDTIISTMLFDYVATHYTWSRFEDFPDVSDDCFRVLLYILNGCCNKGDLADAEGATHIFEYLSKLSNDDVSAISDIYWCILIFMMCHEVAHIYMHHHENGANEHDAYEQECEADAVGYDIYLRMMLKYMHSREDKPSSVLQEYSYTAPMVGLNFFQDLYKVQEILHCEKQDDSYPSPAKRIALLLDISQQEQYHFDSRDGNIVLHNFLDLSDVFYEKLKIYYSSGRLAKILKRGEL